MLREALFYGYSNKSLGGFIIQSPFNKAIVLVSILNNVVTSPRNVWAHSQVFNQIHITKCPRFHAIQKSPKSVKEEAIKDSRQLRS